MEAVKIPIGDQPIGAYAGYLIPLPILQQGILGVTGQIAIAPLDVALVDAHRKGVVNNQVAPDAADALTYGRIQPAPD